MMMVVIMPQLNQEKAASEWSQDDHHLHPFISQPKCSHKSLRKKPRSLLYNYPQSWAILVSDYPLSLWIIKQNKYDSLTPEIYIYFNGNMYFNYSI